MVATLQVLSRHGSVDSDAVDGGKRAEAPMEEPQVSGRGLEMLLVLNEVFDSLSSAPRTRMKAEG